jgi:sulfonate transport system substrate-binding protein
MTVGKRATIILLVMTGVLLIVAFLIREWKEEPTVAPIKTDLTKHPIYSSFRFPKDHTTINFGVQPFWILTSNLMAIVKRDKIFHQELRDLGLEIRFHPFLKGDDLNFFIKLGALDGGVAGDMPTIAIASEEDVVIPASIGNGYASIVANRPMLIRELAGKRIGYAFGSAAHHALLEALASDDLREDQVNLINLDGNQMSKALKTGKVDAFSAWEPLTSGALVTNPQAVVIHRCRYLGFTYFVKSFAEKHPEAVRLILAAEIRASRWMMSDRKNLLLSSRWAVQMSEEVFGKGSETSPEISAAIITEAAVINSDLIIPQTDLQQNGHIHREFNFLKSLGKISSVTRWEEVRKSFAPDIVKQVLRDPQQYRLDEFSYEKGKSD